MTQTPYVSAAECLDLTFQQNPQRSQANQEHKPVIIEERGQEQKPLVTEEFRRPEVVLLRDAMGGLLPRPPDCRPVSSSVIRRPAGRQGLPGLLCRQLASPPGDSFHRWFSALRFHQAVWVVETAREAV